MSRFRTNSLLNAVFAGLFALLAVGHVATARAADLALPPVGLFVAAGPDDCPHAAAIAAHTARLLGHDPFVEHHASPSVRIVFHRTSDGFGARITFHGTPTFAGQRTLPSTTPRCAALAEPVAMILALALDDAAQRDALLPARRDPESAVRALRETADGLAPPQPASPPSPPWRVRLGPSIVARAFDTPRIALGSGFDLHLSRGAFALDAHVGLAHSLPAPNAPTALTLSAHALACLTLGGFDACAGLRAGFHRFAASGLTAVDPPSIAPHLAPTLAFGAAIDLGPVDIRSTFSVALPLIRARVAADGTALWTAPPLVAALHIAILFPLGPAPDDSDATSGTR